MILVERNLCNQRGCRCTKQAQFDGVCVCRRCTYDRGVWIDAMKSRFLQREYMRFCLHENFTLEPCFTTITLITGTGSVLSESVK